MISSYIVVKVQNWIKLIVETVKFYLERFEFRTNVSPLCGVDEKTIARLRERRVLTNHIFFD